MLLSINICGSHLRIAGHYQSQSHNIAGENHDGALKLIFTILILNNFYRDFTLECHHQIPLTDSRGLYNKFAVYQSQKRILCIKRYHNVESIKPVSYRQPA